VSFLLADQHWFPVISYSPMACYSRNIDLAFIHHWRHRIDDGCHDGTRIIRSHRQEYQTTVSAPCLCAGGIDIKCSLQGVSTAVRYAALCLVDRRFLFLLDACIRLVPCHLPADT